MKTFSDHDGRQIAVLTAEPITLEFIRLASATAILFGLLTAAHVLPI